MTKESVSGAFTRSNQLSCLLLLVVHVYLATAVNEEVPRRPKNMSGILMTEKIVPDVIDNVPKYHIMIEYEPLCFINFGNMLNPEAVYWRTFSIDWHCYKDQFFTFLLVGPDEPSRDSPTEREFLYWLIVNIPIDAVLCGDCLAEYIPPRPKRGSGVHRYVYIVLHQTKGKMTFDEPHLTNSSIAERKGWSTKAFMKKHGFAEVYAVNFFKSAWVDPEITTKDPFDVGIPRRKGRPTKKKKSLLTA